MTANETETRYKIQETVGVDRKRRFRVFIGETLMADGLVVGNEEWKRIADCDTRQEAIDYIDGIREGD